MASTVLVVFSLCLVCMVLALPTTKDLRTSDSQFPSEVTLQIKPVLSFEDMILVRTKRQVIRGRGKRGCPQGKIYYMRKCMSFDRYEKMIEGDYYD